MTVHPEKSAAHHSESTPLARLRIREAALRQKAKQLQARAEHLERVGRVHVERMARRIDAHEKIVLGALVKKAGMAIPVTTGEQLSNDHVTRSIRRGLDVQSTQYDRALILGALLWLASVLNSSEEEPASQPTHQQLRDDGERALKRARN
jgi:hypothetical protein